MIYFTIWTEKIPQKGEDAPPSLLLNAEEDTVLLAVYDGLGGAGATMYPVSCQHQEAPVHYSGAYIAANLAKRVHENFFAECESLQDFERYEADLLQKKLQEAFQYEAAQLQIVPSKLKSKLIKTLPTTLAAVLLRIEAAEEMAQNRYHLRCLWAGDSRIYALSKKGMHQLTQDDLHQAPDALENLLQDGTISNCLHADGHFVLHQQDYRFEEPLILLAASDGCFNYLLSPPHFEYLIVNALYQYQVQSVADWKEAVLGKLQAVAGDDCSLSLLTLGFGDDLEVLKAYFINRFRFLKWSFIDPLDKIEARLQALKEEAARLKSAEEALQNEKNALRSHLWELYKESDFPEKI